MCEPPSASRRGRAVRQQASVVRSLYEYRWGLKTYECRSCTRGLVLRSRAIEIKSAIWAGDGGVGMERPQVNVDQVVYARELTT